MKRADERDAALKWELNAGAGGVAATGDAAEEDAAGDAMDGVMVERELTVEEAEEERLAEQERMVSLNPPVIDS